MNLYGAKLPINVLRAVILLGFLVGSAHAACAPGAEMLVSPLSFAGNTWGRDGVGITQGQTIRFCAPVAQVLPPDGKLRFVTADRTGSAQCSWVQLTVTDPLGFTRTSQSTNNTITVPATTGTGQYSVDVLGNGLPGCAITFAVYWQGGSPNGGPAPTPTPVPTPTPRPTSIPPGCPTPTPCHCP